MSQIRSREKIRPSVPLILILLLALGLRLFHNSTQGYTLDESASLLFAGSPGWRSLFWDNHPIFYHVLLKIWLWLVPMTEGWTRSLSAVISVGGVYVMAKIGEVHGSQARGQAMALALAFSTLSIHHAQETRMYALFESMSALHLLATLLFLQTDSRRRRIFYVSSLLGLLATHLLGFLPVLLTLYLVARHYPKYRKHLLLTFALVGLIVMILGSSMRWSALQWQWRVTQMIGPTSTITDLIDAYSQGTFWIFALMLVSFAALVIARDQWARSIGRQLLAFIAGGWIIFELALSMSPRNLYIPRYFVFLNPYFIFLFVLGLESLRDFIGRWKLVAGRAVASLGLLSFVAFFSVAYGYETPAWNQVAAKVIAENGTMVWTTRTKGLALPYYARAKIPVEQFIYDETTIEKIKTAVAKDDVWIVEGFVGRYGYFEGLNRDLIRARLKLSAYEFDNGFAEPVFALKVWKDADAKNRPQLDIDQKEMKFDE